MKTLVVVDMQNDFIDGSLANPAAQAIVPKIAEYIKHFDGEIIFTQDTHFSNYLDTQEGKNLPVKHCEHLTNGWYVNKEITMSAYEHHRDDYCFVEKISFGDIQALMDSMDAYTKEIYLCGTCTDICVISIALNIKAQYPELKIYCIEELCAGLTPEKHAAAIEVMKSCQIEVI